ncbi:MAG TPA: MFS transporter [Candidatus Dormibacteraeota bacterium]|nr:MFS transporter [Candidatus Dormibacteraeota bacterium]
MATAVQAASGPGFVRGLWQRQIPRYPDTARRYVYLGIVVLATITLYYELYINGAVTPSILQGYGISFKYYVLILVFGNALGAFASLFAGLADRWGRANLVAYGLLATALLALVGVPNAHDGFSYGVMYSLITIVEGMVLVATPALVRDFSPQIGRASAMGFWTLGPVIGSLVVTEVTSHSLSHFAPGDWQTQYRIAGIVGMIVWAIAFVGLRELSPQLRDQLMVSLRDRALVEARARSLDVDKALEGNWRRVARPHIVAGALAVSLFLILYYTAVAFMVVYITTVFARSAFTQDDANSMLNWWWGVEAVALVVVGALSDRLLVRKPFMLVGAIGVLVMQLVLIHQTGVSDTSYNTLVVIFAFLAFFIALTYAPWMAAFTETVEKISPAATATGLAVWGWIIRAVVAVSFLLIPVVIGSVTPIVESGAVVQADLKDPKVAAAVQYGPTVQEYLKDQTVAAAVQYGPTVLADLQDAKVAAAVPIIQAHPAVFLQLAQYPPTQIPPAVLASAVQALGGGAQALAQLQTVGAASADPVSGPKLIYVVTHGPQVLAAQSDPVAGPKFAYVAAHGPAVQAALSDPVARAKIDYVAAHGPDVLRAQSNAPYEWQHWFWLCFVGQVIFIPLIFVLSGRWSPARARGDEKAHDQATSREMAALGLSPTA